VNPTIEQKLFWLETPTGQCVPVRGHVSLGRSRTNTIAVNCEIASRRHALLHQDEEGNCLIIDLGSSNGTFVNGSRITHLAQVGVGDHIDIGSERFTLRALTGEESPNLDTATPDGAQLVPCWIVIGDKENPESAANAADCDDSYKTIVSWAPASRRILERNGATAPPGFEGKVFAYWRDPAHDPAIAASVAKALRELQAVQARHRLEFRLALHVGTVVIGASGPNRKKALIGAEVTFAFHMQRLAWVLSAPCLLSEEANRRLSPLLPTRALEPCGLHGYEGDRQFYAF